jgi:HD-GYP domain-containing protein (c-di-GMP phosphodiesterase class II)
MLFFDNAKRTVACHYILVLVLGAVIEARDAYTGGHTWRVAQYSRLLAEQAGLSASEIFLSGLGGFIHDIGKVGIPDQVLNKAGRLSEDEFSLLKTHPTVGKKLLDNHPLGPLVLDSITYQHERFDLQPEIDLELINDLASGAPRSIALQWEMSNQRNMDKHRSPWE